MRDFIFLRNQLFRDKEIISDVWLQSGKPGISQEANEVLYKFPETADELFEYDAIVAFDAPILTITWIWYLSPRDSCR